MSLYHFWELFSCRCTRGTLMLPIITILFCFLCLNLLVLNLYMYVMSLHQLSWRNYSVYYTPFDSRSFCPQLYQPVFIWCTLFDILQTVVGSLLVQHQLLCCEFYFDKWHNCCVLWYQNTSHKPTILCSLRLYVPNCTYTISPSTPKTVWWVSKQGSHSRPQFKYNFCARHSLQALGHGWLWCYLHHFINVEQPQRTKIISNNYNQLLFVLTLYFVISMP